MNVLPKFCLTAAVLAAGLAIPAAAVAAEGIATQSGTLRAGPARDYPDVDHVSGGEQLEIYGCLENYDWCDVSNEDNRGWFPGSRIAFVQHGRRVALPQIAPEIGIGIVGFGVAEYWGSHYRSRPFYGQEQRFQGHDHPDAHGGPRNGAPPVVNAPPQRDQHNNPARPPVVQEPQHPPVAEQPHRPPAAEQPQRPPATRQPQRPPEPQRSPAAQEPQRPPAAHAAPKSSVEPEAPKPPANNCHNGKNCINQ